MTDDLNERLAAWVAPPPSETTRLRLDELLTDPRLPGPYEAKRSRSGLLSLAYASALGLLLLIVMQQPAALPALTSHDLELSGPLVVTPGLPVASQTTATAVSTVDLEGFQAIDNPRIHVNRSTP
ncbi:hypothetical protein [Luteitalea sp.]|uniref:hypothetical protein n=1 Tax=Luteitalea sp. TaxID=2004800 RepID=UPI0025BE750C|nr:hypothetical protein [Luteitalea sp.]